MLLQKCDDEGETVIIHGSQLPVPAERDYRQNRKQSLSNIWCKEYHIYSWKECMFTNISSFTAVDIGFKKAIATHTNKCI